MSRRWMRLAVPAVAVLVAAVSVVLVAATFAHQRSVAGWVANHDLAAGSVIGPQDVRQISVATGGDGGENFSIAQGSPVGERATHVIVSGDLIRPDDVSAQVMVEVAVSLKVSPPLQTGASIDIYATPPAPQAGSTTDAGAGGSLPQAVAPILVARGVSVVDAGPPVVISVPAQEEPLWVALASSQTELMATLSTGVDVAAGGSGYQGAQAIQILNQLAQGAGGGSGTAPSPTASPPSPGGQ